MKNLKIFIVGALLGGLLVGGMMYYQIQNRYVIGQNSGYLLGQYKVMDFLEKNVQNDFFEEKKETGQFLDIKAARLNVVEINGVKTIFLEN